MSKWKYASSIGLALLAIIVFMFYSTLAAIFLILVVIASFLLAISKTLDKVLAILVTSEEVKN